jgi:putative alpha-1,2-mannosidase
MVQLSPDTRLTGWDGCSGYHFSDDILYGFSHTHLSGTGISDYGDILFLPQAGEGEGELTARFDKATERAEPGYYSVRLVDDAIDVELTVTERTGLQRYIFPEGKPAWVVVDLAHRDELLDSSLKIVSDREIEGFRRSTGWAKDQMVYFVASFSRPFQVVNGRFYFGDKGGELLIRVGISAVDADGARRNLEVGQGERPFAEIRREARDRWNDALGRIAVEGGTAAEREIFYTALYHAMIAPNLYSDVDGRYRGMDGKVHRAEGRRHYTVFSLWDTFRSAHPLYTLIETERTREFIETFLAMYAEGGRLPVWELAANETDTMIGYHAIPVIADAWVKGIRGFAANAALDAMVDSATRDHFGLAAYKKQGFIGSEDDGESVSKTLEYAYDDWCIARLAEGLGRETLKTEYDRRSQGWRHLLDPETGFMRARRNQRWLTPFDPARVDNNYTEANAWQYSFFVPHDLEGLMAALGGEERFVQRLDELFESDSGTTGREQADITGLIGQYAHGNEPSHHMAWLYHYAGRPDLSARRVRRILDELYTAEPDGLSGNEDCGQMSAWYVLAAMGIYPVTPGSDEYVLGVPLFPRVVLNPGSGHAFTIRTGGRGLFIESAVLNGKPLARSFLKHGEIAHGGELLLNLSDRPGEVWGRALKNRPRSRVNGPRVPAAPFLRCEADSFRQAMTVELDSFDKDVTFRYAMDGMNGMADYKGPFEITDSTRLRFFAERGGRRSPIMEAYLHRIPNDWAVELGSVPNQQYTAGGAMALIDGLRGHANWRTGGWMGFQDADFSATLDLGTIRPVTRAGAGFLQDQRSWIWMPAEVVISVSTDGENFQEVARLGIDVAEDVQEVFLQEVVATLDGVKAQYVKISAHSFGTIPDWHPGRGGGAFIFVDELIVE